jgi:hypothetical protein
LIIIWGLWLEKAQLQPQPQAGWQSASLSHIQASYLSSLCRISVVFFAVLELELRPTHWAIPPALFCDGFFPKIGSLKLFSCSGFEPNPPDLNLLSS